MATPTNPIASIAGAVTSAVASGAMAPATGIIGVIGSLVSKALDFIPDPQKKLELQQHALDLQAAAASQELDARTKQIQASMQASSGDKSLWWIRSFFCVIMTLTYVWNYAIRQFFHQAPVDFPVSVQMMFATIMLGLVGAPDAFAALKNLVGMVPGVIAQPGDSQISILGVKIGNKS